MSNNVLNPMVSFLYSMGPTNANSNQVAENNLAHHSVSSDQNQELQHEIQQVKDDLQVVNDTTTKYLDAMEQMFFFDSTSRVIVVSGIAGNGKSQLIYDLFNRHFSPKDSYNILSNINSNKVESFRKVDLSLYTRSNSSHNTQPFASNVERFLINDLSECYEGSENRNEFTKSCFETITQDQSISEKGRIILLGANSGALLNILEDSLQNIEDIRQTSAEQELSANLKPFAWAKNKTADQVALYKKAITNLKLALMDHKNKLLQNLLANPDDKQDSNTSKPPIVFFDTTALYQIEDFNNIAYKILNHSTWLKCQQCSSVRACPIYNNRRLLLACNFAADLQNEHGPLTSSENNQRLNAPFPRLVQVLLGLGEQLTIRNIFMLLSNTLLGFVANNDEQAKVQEPILNCQLVQKPVFNNSNQFSLCYTPKQPNSQQTSRRKNEHNLVWYSNPFDNFFGLNIVNFTKKYSQRRGTYEPKNHVIFEQFNRLSLGQTNSPVFENELKEALQRYQSDLDSKRKVTGEDTSLLQEIIYLKESFEQQQNKIKDAIITQKLLNQTSNSWFRWFFFNHVANDTKGINYYELTSYHYADEFLYLSDWARAFNTRHAFNKSNQANKLNNIWKKLQDGLYCLFTHNKTNDNKWEKTLPIVVTSNISSKPCSMQLDSTLNATFQEFSLSAQYADDDDKTSYRSYFYIRPVEQGHGLIEIVAQISVFSVDFSNAQDIVSSKQQKLSISQTLNLKDFEYLRQLSDGLLPQSLSRECNSRFLLFKDRVFSKMVELKTHTNTPQANNGQPKFMALKDINQLR